jgi:hypothetical protein
VVLRDKVVGVFVRFSCAASSKMDTRALKKLRKIEIKTRSDHIFQGIPHLIQGHLE